MPGKRIANLTPAQFEKFCQAVALTGNQSEAYHRIKPNVKRETAAVQGFRLLRNVKVQERVRDLKVIAHEALMGKYEHALQEMSNNALWDPAGMFDEDGKLLQLHEMDETSRKMVNEIEIHLGDDDQPLRTAKIKYGRDKRGYLQMMLQHYNAFEAHKNAGATREIAIYMIHEADANL